MPTAQDFQSFTASVFPSQSSEIVVSRQSVLAEYGRELRSILNQLPPDVTQDLLGEYGAATPEVMSSVEQAIQTREFAYEHAAQQADIGQEWLQVAAHAHSAGLDEATLAADDLWNTPQP